MGPRPAEYYRPGEIQYARESVIFNFSLEAGKNLCLIEIETEFYQGQAESGNLFYFDQRMPDYVEVCSGCVAKSQLSDLQVPGDEIGRGQAAGLHFFFFHS